MTHTNQDWYPYEEFGSFYKLVSGELLCCPMLSDGSREADDYSGPVDWACGVEPAHEQRMNEIVAELERLP